ncbi:acyltransferase-domain-containing protein [Auriscalpium vulgare]|uniref:Acyltransferase-domain-containing protein n=1 Tax=Auriscalpium vulgare TaxID=40419 RepID=A0ACB8RV30_9AGAM|nr:acyltransferase-domain-containing protein [Auriscalpium vulgare]
MLNVSQFAILLPLRLLPWPWARSWHNTGVRLSKGAFGTLLILMCQWFAPTRLVVTFEQEGPGALTEEQIKDVVQHDDSGRVQLNLPQKAVIIANHQMYADWWYAWCLCYFMGTHRDIFIVLKKSLKWLPVIGWGMQFFDFIFLARSWAADRLYLVEKLASLGRHAEERDTPFTFVLYPEGTLYSADTRPISKKYADKIGIPDLNYALLPRSTGLLYSLRALAPRIPNLQLIDITVAYPGIEPFGYGQSYYTLRSIFVDRVPPPAVHMHIRVFDVTHGVPIGDVSQTNPAALPSGSSDAAQQPLEVEVPEAERETFDLWLRERWHEKDAFLAHYLEAHTFSPSLEKSPPTVIPLELKHYREVLDAFAFFVPAVLGYFGSKL